MSRVINLQQADPAPDTGCQNAKWQATSTPSGTDPTSGAPYYDTSCEVPNTGGISIQSSTYTTGAGDCGKLIVFTAGSPVTLTLPATPPTVLANQWNTAVENIGTGNLTIQATPGAKLDGLTGGSIVLTQNTGCQVFTNGTDYYTQRGLPVSSSGMGFYYGYAQTSAGGGESIITLGSTPSSTNSIIVTVNGVILPPSYYTVSTAVITLNSSRTFGTGDVVCVRWSTLNSTPGGATLSAPAQGLRGSAVYASSDPTSANIIAFPAASQAGDRAIICYGTTDAGPPAAPTGWTASNGLGTTFWTGAVYTKVLTSADITAGSVNFGQITCWAASIAVFIGDPGIVQSNASQNANVPVTLATTASASAGQTVLYFGSQGWSKTPSPPAPGTISWNRGSSLGSASNGVRNVCVLYSETLASSGVVSAIETFSSPYTDGFHGDFNYQAIVVLGTTVPPSGTFPLIKQSQILGSGLITNPMTTVGDMIIGGTVVSGVATPTRAAASTATYVWTANGPGVAPSWQAPGSGSGGSYTKIAEVILAATQTTVTFSSIPSTYRNLIIKLVARTNGSGSTQDCYIQFNGDTGANYSRVWINSSGSGTTQGGNYAVSQVPVFWATAASATANWPTIANIEIPNYAATVFAKAGIATQFTAIGASAGNLYPGLDGFIWNNPAAITDITIGITAAGSFVVGSTFTLYGVS